ncbi:MAG: 50S ribosome-binding GTPase [Propionibacteriaceae bacterium]|nr:50S ribosome-binding GTPase [Propionibacteriaceae bacterium]
MATKDKAVKDLGARLRALRQAAENARGRVDDDVVDPALRVVERAGRRLEASGDATVVALGGATGSGKSSTFNALTGTELATPGVRRPTTRRTLAVSFGADSADDLLDWLEIPNRHRAEPAPTGGKELESGQKSRALVPFGGKRPADPARELDGLVLLDLPDHDSTEVTHRQEVDRLVELVDMLVWVVDPQKYADAALHDRYLKPLARYAPVMMVVLNQIDRLSEAERERCLTDLRRLLDSEGLEKVEIAAISATTGEGVAELRSRIRKRVAAKKTAAERIVTDLDAAAEKLAAASGMEPAGQVDKDSANRLNKALSVAAGVPVVSEAVGKAWRHRGGIATGWPALAWIAKFRPDPLRRLHLDRWGLGKRGKEIDPARVSRTSLPATTSVQQARVDSAVRDLADEAAEGLPRGWAVAVRDASRQHQDALPDQLDRAIATTDLGLDGDHGWWTFVKIVQWLLIACVVTGLGWLAVAFVMLYLQLPPLPEITWWGLPAPTVLAGAGVLAGLLVALFARIGVEVGARRAERRARGALVASIANVTREKVVEPINAELDRHDLVRTSLEQALR